MTSSHPAPTPCHWFSRLASALDPRSAPRLAWLLLGAVLARGRRTVTSWIRAAGLSGEFRPCYTTVSAVAKRTDLMAAHPAHEVVKPLVADAGRLTFALDGTTTKPCPWSPPGSSVGRPGGGKKTTPALTVRQVRRAIGQVLHRVVGCDRPARVRRTMERWLRRNEEARFYHWKRRNRLPPRRPGQETQGTQ